MGQGLPLWTDRDATRDAPQVWSGTEKRGSSVGRESLVSPRFIFPLLPTQPPPPISFSPRSPSPRSWVCGISCEESPPVAFCVCCPPPPPSTSPSPLPSLPQVMGLRDQLRGLLKQVVVHPRMVDSPDLAHGGGEEEWGEGRAVCGSG